MLATFANLNRPRGIVMDGSSSVGHGILCLFVYACARRHIVPNDLFDYDLVIFFTITNAVES